MFCPFMFILVSRDNKMNLLKPIVEELNLLDEQQKEWETKLSQVPEKQPQWSTFHASRPWIHVIYLIQLNAEVAEFNEAREREVPLVQEVDTELKELRQTISELNNHQMSLRTNYRKLKEKSGEMDVKVSPPCCMFFLQFL